MEKLTTCPFVDATRHPVTTQAIERMAATTGMYRTPLMALTGQQDEMLRLLDFAAPEVWSHSPESRQAAPGIWRIIDDLGVAINALHRCATVEDIDAVERGLTIAWASNRFVGGPL